MDALEVGEKMKYKIYLERYKEIYTTIDCESFKEAAKKAIEDVFYSLDYPNENSVIVVREDGVKNKFSVDVIHITMFEAREIDFNENEENKY